MDILRIAAEVVKKIEKSNNESCIVSYLLGPFTIHNLVIEMPKGTPAKEILKIAPKEIGYKYDRMVVDSEFGRSGSMTAADFKREASGACPYFAIIVARVETKQASSDENEPRIMGEDESGENVLGYPHHSEWDQSTWEVVDGIEYDIEYFIEECDANSLEDTIREVARDPDNYIRYVSNKRSEAETMEDAASLVEILKKKDGKEEMEDMKKRDSVNREDFRRWISTK